MYRELLLMDDGVIWLNVHALMTPLLNDNHSAPTLHVARLATRSNTTSSLVSPHLLSSPLLLRSSVFVRPFIRVVNLCTKKFII